jgi:hypothetical protein
MTIASTKKPLSSSWTDRKERLHHLTAVLVATVLKSTPKGITVHDILYHPTAKGDRNTASLRSAPEGRLKRKPVCKAASQSRLVGVSLRL